MKINRSVRRRGLLVVALLALFTVVGFFVLPPIVRSQMEKRLSRELGRVVTVGKVHLNPFTLCVAVENFRIQEADGSTTFLHWERLFVNFDAVASIRKEWVLSEVTLTGFETRARVNPDQTLNVSDLLAKFTPPPAANRTPPETAKPARPVRVARLQVTNARIDFADLSRKSPFATVLGPLTFELTEFRTVSESGAPYRFEATTEAGEKLACSGTLRAEPFHSAGELLWENITLPKYAPYYAEQLQAEVTGGTLSVRGRYEIDLTGGKRVLKISDTAVQLRGVALRERATQQTAVELPLIDLQGIEADALAQKATVRSVALGGGRIRARREKDGSINLLSLLQPPTASTGIAGSSPARPGTPPTPTAKPPEVMITEVTLKDFQIEVSDLAAPRPVSLALSALQVALKNVTLAEGARMPLQLGFGLGPQGTVHVNGSVGLTPLVADLKIAVSRIDLLPLSPYLEQFVHARLTQGTVTATLDTQVSLASGQPPAATVAGDITVEKFALVDSTHNEELAGFGELTLRGLRASTTPDLTVALEEIKVAGPYARAILAADQSLNLLSIAKTSDAPLSRAGQASGGSSSPAPATTATSGPPSTPAALPSITVGKITIAAGDFRFTDRSITPAVNLAITQFGGTIAGLSSKEMAKARVDLKALVDGAGPVAITGTLDPLGAKPTVDLKIDLKNMDLVPFSPYSGKYAGFELARGKLVLDVKLLVDGPKINAANVITLNQFTFGSPVKSPTATSLPVRLGVALLKDIDGKIVIDVPVQGSLDDPSFGIGRVVLRVVVNLLQKAAVSPFSLLGAAFGGGGEELAFQEFTPGSAELQEAELKKLQTMTQALVNRPGLSLDLEGSYDPPADTFALKRVKLEERIRRTVWEQKHQADPNIPPPAEIVFSAEERVAAIKQLFDTAFPPGTEFGTPLPAAPAVAAPPPPPPPTGLFKRIVSAVSFQPKKTGPSPTDQENTRLAAEHAQAVKAAMAAGLPLDEITSRLAENMTVEENDLRALAQARAQGVRSHLIETGKIAPDRLFLAKDQRESAQPAKGPRVFLRLQ